MCKESTELNKSFVYLIRYFLNKLNDFHTNLLIWSFLLYLKVLFIFYNPTCKYFKEWSHEQNKISDSFKQSLICLVYPITEHWHVICAYLFAVMDSFQKPPSSWIFPEKEQTLGWLCFMETKIEFHTFKSPVLASTISQMRLIRALTCSFLRPILILSYHLRLCLPSSL
jgi:hypothetical protein